MSTNFTSNDKGGKLELDAADDMAFDDAALDAELDDGAMTSGPSAKPARGMGGAVAGIVLLGVLGAGGYFGYQQLMAGDATAPAAAIPGDVMAGAGDPSAAPLDPMLATAPADPVMGDAGMAPPMVDAAAPSPLDGMAPPPAPEIPPAALTDATLPTPAQPLDADPMAALTTPADAPVPAPLDAPAVAEAVPATQPMPEQQVVTEQVVAAEPVVVAEPPAAAPVPASAPAADAATTQELRDKIQSLENRLADLDRAMSDLSREKAAAPIAATAPEVTKADLKALERRIESLATTKAAATSRPVPVEKAPVSTVVMPKPAAPAPVVLTPPPARPTMTPSTATIPTAVDAGRSVAVPAPPPVQQPAMAAPVTGAAGWQLRSAQPGRAALAQSGSQELRNVAVGDEVPGLGRVLSIAQGADGRWVVRGTLGSVSQ